ALLAGADRRLYYLAAFLIALGALSTAVFRAYNNLSLLDAVYFTVTVITTTGFGDISLLTAPPGLKIFGMVLMLLGATSLAVIYAFITDTIVGARLARSFGAPGRGLRDHIVICGLGNIGYRVAERLAALGLPTAAVDRNEDGRFLVPVRRLGVPVLVADATLTETLRALSLESARCLLVLTGDDLANLETALSARALNPTLRVVVRLFDAELAARVERFFGVDISRSVHALAASEFAAA